MKTTRYSIPTLKKIVKRGTNHKLLEWLQGYADFFYNKGYADALDMVAQRDNNGGVERSTDGGEPRECEGLDAAYTDSCEAGAVGSEDSEVHAGASES